MAEIGVNLGQGLMMGLLYQDVPGQVAKHLANLSGSAALGLMGGVSGGGAGALAAVSGGRSSVYNTYGATAPGRVTTIDNHFHASMDDALAKKVVADQQRQVKPHCG